MAYNSTETRRRIIEAGLKLFYGANIIEVGMDDVASEAGITKKTLYYHYPSKAELVRACYEARVTRILALYRDWTADGLDARGKIAGIFANLNTYTQAAAFKGCAFMRASCEFAAKHDNPVRDIVSRYKSGLEDLLADLLRNDEYASPECLARQIIMMIDGCLAHIMFHGRTDYARDAATAVDFLLRSSQRRNPQNDGNSGAAAVLQ